MSKRVITLKRFGHKGQFVEYPTKWQSRMAHTGKRRYDTHCDLLLGVCACGERHHEDESWIQEMLRHYNTRIETHEEWLARMRKETSST